MKNSKDLTLKDLMAMNSTQLRDVMDAGHPLDLEVLGQGRQYLGVDLSLPGWARKVLWHTFRKAFIKDDSGIVRGWNVRMKQAGIEGPQTPLLGADGKEKTFGHYHVKSAEGVAFSGGWKGAHFLDYGHAGNPFWDLARLGYTPLVAVNAGSQDLLLGWEIVKVGSTIALPLYWALQYDGPLQNVVEKVE